MDIKSCVINDQIHNENTADMVKRTNPLAKLCSQCKTSRWWPEPIMGLKCWKFGRIIFDQVASIFHFGGEKKLAHLMHRGIFGSLGENLFQTFSYRKTDKKWVLWSLFLRTAALMDGWVNRIPWLAYDEKPDLLLWWPSCINFQRINLTYFLRTHIPYMYIHYCNALFLIGWLTHSLLLGNLIVDPGSVFSI